MLKKMGIRKICVTTCALFVIGIMYLFPNSNVKIKEEVIEYTESDLKEVYLLNRDNYLSEVVALIKDNNEIDILKSKLMLLTIDNKDIPSKFMGVIPKNTKVLSIDIKDSICTVDFSKEILGVSIDNEEKMIEAIVYTLTSSSSVSGVIIKVEGEVLERTPISNKLLPNILDRSYGINKSYDINSLYDLTKTTIYYTTNIDGDIYYVPVTKVSNSKDEKISVIINELKSSVMYQSNLASYLSSKANLESYKVEEEVMYLTFNDKIFNSIYDNNIMEEVVYTIGKSVKDNYDVKEVIFYVDDKEITKF